MQWIGIIIGVIFGGMILLAVGFFVILSLFYKKVQQSNAIVKNGLGGSKVSFTGTYIIPVFHNWEIMDVSVKRVEIVREGKDGLICKDNLRADIRVAFFVRVNHTSEDVLRVAKLLGVKKASDTKTLMEFFDAKFSEGLKTVGKKFDFVELYTNRETFKEEILQVIGTDLNGYVLDDAAIDYLEQTNLKYLDPDNVLDAEGIKKIIDLTSEQKIRSNAVRKHEERTLKEQNVSTREAILELEKQQSEAEAKQKREVDNAEAREESQIKVVQQEERLKAETTRLKVEEELLIAEENKKRQVIVAEKAKEATEAVETERVEKSRLLERTETEKLVALAEIEKNKKIEVENKDIQEVIKERVMVQKAVVIEEEKIKDTQEFATANRYKQVNITKAEAEAEVKVIDKVKSAEAEKNCAEILAEKEVILAETDLKTSFKKAESKKVLADAIAEEAAVGGVSESRVIKAKAEAYEIDGTAKAKVLELDALARAKGVEAQGIAEAKIIEMGALAKAKGVEAQGLAEALVIKEKLNSEADGLKGTGLAEAIVIKEKGIAEAEGITKKAEAMKKLDAIGREHEEFKLKLDKEKEVELASIQVNAQIAQSQAQIISEGLKSANIDIVGGESMFFDKLVNSITFGKQVDGMVGKSKVLTDVKETFVNGSSENFKRQLKSLVANFNINTEDVKNLTISGAIMKLMGTSGKFEKDFLSDILTKVKAAGMANDPAKNLLD